MNVLVIEDINFKYDKPMLLRKFSKVSCSDINPVLFNAIITVFITIQGVSETEAAALQILSYFWTRKFILQTFNEVHEYVISDKREQ